MNLQGKTVLLGVTGSIAAYKIASLASMLIKKGSVGPRFDDEERLQFYKSDYL